ncbi:putative thiazole-containing bacteriocin maturation protein [Bacillus gobiensis]|uniref:putative thiazole-containing bacteriocin maturation protein n=1 Tax=Bacillus gobiensis TaxID=1441095 RepID=UPI003D235D42
MTILTQSMRLKVRRDTFFLPDPKSGVYFRNNVSSFRMEGSMIDQWVEKLIPMFNGEYTLGDLTDGLPGLYRDRVYEIAEVLYRNGYVRDVSKDRPHQLTVEELKKHASQIEFLNSFGDSGAYRFQAYRQAKVLAVGSGSFFISLVSALLESGLSKFHVLITDSIPTNRDRITELTEHARQTDPGASIEEVTLHKERESSWAEILQPFHSILYVSQEGDIEELRGIHSYCRKEKKLFLPAVCFQQAGMAGPLVHPDSEGCWESAWRRLHKSVMAKNQQYSNTASAMLANVIVFELFKKLTEVEDSEQRNQFFLLDLDTLEGNWHSFSPHPLVTGHAAAQWVQDFDRRLEQTSSKGEPSRLFLYFSQLTSAESGIFHIWEEGDIIQLPLAQCQVQAVDPMSEGPAELLPNIVCSDLTHEKARREAGLAGIESYVSRMAGLLIPTLPPHQDVVGSMAGQREFIGVGAGETFSEGVCRGLQKCLAEKLSKVQAGRETDVLQVQLTAVEDGRCHFYLQALTTMQGEPIIALGEKVFGFPVVWVGTNNSWYANIGLNITMALQKSLQQALLKAQNKTEHTRWEPLEVSPVLLGEKVPQSLVIQESEEITKAEVLQSAMKVLKQNQKRLLIFDLAVEPFMQEELEVFGVLIREEESR